MCETPRLAGITKKKASPSSAILNEVRNRGGLMRRAPIENMMQAIGISIANVTYPVIVSRYFST
ncbi:MAG: hypothetical protein IKD59_06265 [Lachnospiraceae bacterium]|nr:hypothetical protein [Lachnospiraceae bacterium]